MIQIVKKWIMNENDDIVKRFLKHIGAELEYNFDFYEAQYNIIGYLNRLEEYIIKTYSQKNKRLLPLKELKELIIHRTETE